MCENEKYIPFYINDIKFKTGCVRMRGWDVSREQHRNMYII